MLEADMNVTHEALDFRRDLATTRYKQLQHVGALRQLYLDRVSVLSLHLPSID